MNDKVLLVGDARICPQVAYVMDWQNYAMVERLTAEDVIKYSDYKIVICAFKRKSKNLVLIKDEIPRMSYLNEVCQQIDQQYAQEKRLWLLHQSKPPTLAERIGCHIQNHDLMAAGIRGLVRFIKRPFKLHSYALINCLPVGSLRASELFVKVLYSPPTNVVCERLERIAYLNYDGNVFGCCGWVPAFGNLKVSDLDSIYNSVLARIIKLSSLNRSYCLCNLQTCEFAKYADITRDVPECYSTTDYPQELVVAIDRTCNLKCPSCRKDYYTKPNAREQEITERAVNELERSGWLEKSELLNLAGDGEVFHSPIYRRILTSNVKRKQIHILTNGTLFNEQNWQLLKGKYERIGVSVSLDSATEATFRKLRGGDYRQLLKNLEMLSNLRQMESIAFLEFRFVVQKDNYREIPVFVEFGKRFHADVLLYSRLNNWRSFTTKEYREKSLLIKHKYLTRELYEVLQDPILRDPIVDLTAFQLYLVNSAKRYDKKRK